LTAAQVLGLVTAARFGRVADHPRQREREHRAGQHEDAEHPGHRVQRELEVVRDLVVRGRRPQQPVQRDPGGTDAGPVRWIGGLGRQQKITPVSTLRLPPESMSSGRNVPDSPASRPASSRPTQISQSGRRNRPRKNTRISRRGETPVTWPTSHDVVSRRAGCPGHNG